MCVRVWVRCVCLFPHAVFFTQSSFTVREDEGEVEVCLTGDRGDRDVLVVTIRTMDVTASGDMATHTHTHSHTHTVLALCCE